jgi:hypothetical protein
MIWLVDMTSYAKSIDPQLEAYKKDYFRMKSYARYQKIGPTAPVKTKVYGTGLLRLATLLHRNGCPVRYLDRQLLEKALGAGEELPQLVAFSCVCPTIPAAAKLCRQIKAMSASTEVVLGGIHVNVATEQTRQKFPEFDRLIVGFELEAAQQLTAVELIGDTAVLESLSADDIIAEVDMQQSSEIAEGQVLMPVKIYVPNGSRVWAKGSYEVVVAIEVDSGTKAE